MPYERCEPHECNHVNAFIDLEGVPYALAEYLDRRQLQQVDRSMIKSEIFVDQSESMRAVVDINIDDIGKRGSDGLPAIIGNNTKQKKLIEMIGNHADRLDHQLNVLRKGIILRVSYQLENARNQQVLRSMSEDIRITDRNYFLDINPRNVDDNAIIVNFCNSAISTINEFTHGRDRMVIRITNIQMYYECLKRDPKMPRIKQSLYAATPDPMQSCYRNEQEYYQYHQQMQHQHMIGMPGCTCGDNMGNSYDSEKFNHPSLQPSTWTMFNRFYHFDNGNRDMIFHFQEINDPCCKTILIPCGNIVVNRTFMINPGHRIIFKFCIWKNDATFVPDTTRIARELKVPYLEDSCNHHHHHHDHEVHPDYETLIRMLHESKRMEERQNRTINKLILMVENLQEMVKNQQTPVIPEDPIDPPPVDPPDTDTPSTDECNCGCSEFEDKLSQLESEINDLKGYHQGGSESPGDSNCGCSEIRPFPNTRIEEIIEAIK